MSDKINDKNELVDRSIQTPSDSKLDVSVFSDTSRFGAMWKIANALSSGTMIPRAYQENPSNIVIALDMANRLNINPLAVMQNLYIVNGSPSWSSQFIITVINQSSRFDSTLKFNLDGKGENMSCYAYAIDHDGEIVKGSTITIEMAKAEGWYSKSGSKWKTMPEQMLQYRAAAFFGRIHCPDLIMGVYTDDEVRENRSLQGRSLNVIEDVPNPIVKKEMMSIEDAIKESNESILKEKDFDRESGEKEKSAKEEVIKNDSEIDLLSDEEMEREFALTAEEMLMIRNEEQMELR